MWKLKKFVPIFQVVCGQLWEPISRPLSSLSFGATLPFLCAKRVGPGWKMLAATRTRRRLQPETVFAGGDNDGKIDKQSPSSAKRGPPISLLCHN